MLAESLNVPDVPRDDTSSRTEGDFGERPSVCETQSLADLSHLVDEDDPPKGGSWLWWWCRPQCSCHTCAGDEVDGDEPPHRVSDGMGIMDGLSSQGFFSSSGGMFRTMSNRSNHGNSESTRHSGVDVTSQYSTNSVKSSNSRKGSGAFSLLSAFASSNRTSHNEEDGEQNESREQGTPAANLRILTMIKSGLKAFQLSSAANVPPTQQELVRGVRIDRVYDFFDFMNKKTTVKLTPADVIHNRFDEPEEYAEHSDEDVDVSPASILPRRSISFRAGVDTEKETVAKRKSISRRDFDSVGDAELVTHWGALVAKVLHSRVFDFTHITDKTIIRKRLETTAKKGRLLHSVKERAKCIVFQVIELARRIFAQKTDMFDSEWEEEGLLLRLFSDQYVDNLMLLATAARKLFASQPVLVEASAPCRVFGDTHGQLRDVLLLFAAYGLPSLDEDNDTQLVFNGDFVDRGAHQLEVVGILFALKIALPDKVWLVRGNHEDKAMNERYGFKDACIAGLGKEFGKKIFTMFQSAFNEMPIACRVNKKILIVHGGIGDGLWKLEDLNKIERPIAIDKLTTPETRWIYNIFWSDPIEDSDRNFTKIYGVHLSPRGQAASQFAWNVTKIFCAANGISLVIRSHQCKEAGMGFEVMHEKLLLRVFSARDYEGNGNDGAVLMVRPPDKHIPLLSVRPQVLRSTTKSRVPLGERRRTRKSTVKDFHRIRKSLKL